jgi:uncharacterized OsmC-like protein
VAEVRARVFEYRVSTDPDWTVHSDRGGSTIARDDGWTPEHLVLAGLTRCTLTSLEYHAKRAGVAVTATADAHGSVTRRDEDGRFAFVEISVAFDVSLEPRLEDDALRTLIESAERDCFVGASLTVTPAYTWTVDGEEL